MLDPAPCCGATTFSARCSFHVSTGRDCDTPSGRHPATVHALWMADRGAGAEQIRHATGYSVRACLSFVLAGQRMRRSLGLLNGRG